MRLTVIKDSVIYNGKIITKGNSFDANDLIGQSLIERGYVAIAGSVEETVDEAELRPLEELSYSELKQLASEMGLSANGKKEDLIERIAASQTKDSVEETVDEAEASDEMPDTSMPE